MKALAYIAAAIVIVVGAAGIFILRKGNARLHDQAEGLRRKNREVVHLREESAQLKALLANVEHGNATRAIQAALEKTRREVADLEKGAQRAPAAGAEVSHSDNRDPEKGLTRLEHFQNVGRGTPAAAFQTLVWAAMKGDDPALVALLSVTGAARDKAEALLATLPEAARAKYPTPENLAALPVVSELVEKGVPLQVVGYDLEDPSHATLHLSTGREKEIKLPMRLGPGGWQVIVPEQAIDALKKRMSEVPPELPAKK